MSKGKYQNKKHNRGTKTLVMLLALVLTLGCVIGGTVAWLTASSDKVENTFTVGDITIDLDEHKLVTGTDGNPALGTEEVITNTYEAFVPGQTLPKDPFVTVEANSEKCWLFVEATETNNTLNNEKIIDWAFDLAEEGQDGWKILPDNANVIYRVVDKANAEQTFDVLKDDQVTVNSKITKTDVTNTIKSNAPKLEFKAYAVQYDYLKNGDADVTTAAAAWAMAKPTT